MLLQLLLLLMMTISKGMAAYSSAIGQPSEQKSEYTFIRQETKSAFAFCPFHKLFQGVRRLTQGGGVGRPLTAERC